MKILLDIPDNQASFALKVLKSLSFIKKAQPISDNTISLWSDLKDAANEVRLHKEGNIKLKTAQELLNEL